MNSDDIKRIVGVEKPRKLKRYVLTAGGEIIESKYLEYDNFMECYGIGKYNEEIKMETFEVVVIVAESDDYLELEEKVSC